LVPPHGLAGDHGVGAKWFLGGHAERLMTLERPVALERSLRGVSMWREPATAVVGPSL
jgi:hypothetical protein